MTPTILAHLNKNPQHLAALLAWDRETAPWVAFTGTWWSQWPAEELAAAAEWVGRQRR